MGFWSQNQAGAGGAGGSVVLHERIELNNAQFKAVPVSGALLIAGTAGKWFQIHSWTMVFDLTTEYTFTDQSLYLTNEGNETFYSKELTVADSWIPNMVGSAGTYSFPNLPTSEGSLGFGAVADIVGDGLYLRGGGSGAFGGGNAANTVIIDIYYSLVDNI